MCFIESCLHSEIQIRSSIQIAANSILYYTLNKTEVIRQYSSWFRLFGCMETDLVLAGKLEYDTKVFEDMMRFHFH